MFYVAYVLAELRRRSGRTILTALGLAIGIGLVVTVNALSTGLNDAQARILKPLTGVGTDMSVTRPISFQTTGGGFGFPRLSPQERQQLQQENGGRRFGLGNLGKPGSHFSRDNFVATSQLSFPASEVATISRIAGVSSAAGGLTLNAIHVEGTVPMQSQLQQRGGFQGPGAGGGGFTGPRNINLTNLTVSGVDPRNRELGAITPGQITHGRFFSTTGTDEAILDQSYAAREGIAVGGTVTVGGTRFTVVGIAKTPLGGQSSDVYLHLGELQKLAGRSGRVNTVYVRAQSAGDVASVSSAITKTFSGASVTTSQDLANRITGTLVDAKNLAGKLGDALGIVALLGAFLIASLLTLASVAKRVRELGTLKALGWSQGLVVRQIAGESLVQGLLGGLLGLVLGVAGAAAIVAFAPELHATVPAAQSRPRFFGPFGSGDLNTPSTAVTLGAPVTFTIALAAVGLALVGGLVAGAAGGLRAARLRPADAIRHLD